MYKYYFQRLDESGKKIGDVFTIEFLFLPSIFTIEQYLKKSGINYISEVAIVGFES